MIASVRMVNWRAFDDVTLQFSPGVNIFIGQTDSGKSAIIGAFDWVINDRPKGDPYRRHGTKSTEVHITLDSRHCIRRFRSASVNSLFLDSPTGETTEYKNFRGGLPPDIVKLLNVGNLNFQFQFDDPFLLSDTAGNVSRRLNELGGFYDIDPAIRFINSSLSSKDTSIELVQEELTQKQNLLSQLPDCTEGWEAYRRMNSMWEKLEGWTIRLSRLRPILEESKRLSQGFGVLRTRVTSMEGLVERVKTLGASLSARTETSQKLKGILDNLGAALDVREAARVRLQAEPHVTRARALLEEWKNGSIRVQRLRNILCVRLSNQNAAQKLRKIIRWCDTIPRWEEKAEAVSTKKMQLEALYRRLEILSQLRASREQWANSRKAAEKALLECDMKVCPTCNQTVNYETLIASV